MSMNINMKPDYSFLFSGMNNKSGSGMGSLNFLSDYASIKNGSYGRLLKAYYNKMDSSDSSSSKVENDKNSSQSSTSVSADSAKTLANIDKSADKLKASADALTNRGENSIFNEKEVTKKNEDGTTTTTKEYDMDAIYKAVSDFAGNYNALLDQVGKSDASAVQKAASNMTNITDLYSKTLEKVGITIGEDKKLTVDEKAFKAADMSTIKATFNKSPSFASTVSSQASFIDSTASREATKANTYNFAGRYSNNYSMGNMFNGFF